MSIYKKITRENLTTSKTQVFKKHTLSSSDTGIANYKFNSASSSISTEGSYYNSLKMNFYLSSSNYATTESKFNSPYHTKFEYNSFYLQHLNKFHGIQEGHFYSIPQDYFGQYIKPGSFELNDKSVVMNSGPNSTSESIIIKDDKFGNLYATNAVISSSADSSISSSDNYVGNIFYKTGVVTITETGSFYGTYDLSDTTPEKTSPSMNAQNNLPYGFYWKPDGTKYWMIGSAGTSEIFEFNISGSTWDVGSAAYSGNSFVLNYSNGRDISFRDDGLKIYSLSGNTDKIYEHNLSTAWDIKTITSTSQSFDISQTDDAPYGFYFRNDGLKVYMTGRENDKVYEMNMSTAWDISSITSTSQSYALSASISSSLGVSENEMGGIIFHPDGTRMYTTGDKQNMIYEHRLSTAWDITTATYHTSKSVVDEENRITAVQWKTDGSKMYILGFGADMIDQYNLPSASFYSDLGTNYSMSFDSAKDIYVSEYSLLLKPNEFNVTNNPSARAFNSSSNPDQPMTHYLTNELTASGWSPYFNTVGFYDDDDNLLMKAKYPQNIQKRKDIPLILKIKMDW